MASFGVTTSVKKYKNLSVDKNKKNIKRKLLSSPTFKVVTNAEADVRNPQLMFIGHTEAACLLTAGSPTTSLHRLLSVEEKTKESRLSESKRRKASKALPRATNY